MRAFKTHFAQRGVGNKGDVLHLGKRQSAEGAGEGADHRGVRRKDDGFPVVFLGDAQDGGKPACLHFFERFPARTARSPMFSSSGRSLRDRRGRSRRCASLPTARRRSRGGPSRGGRQAPAPLPQALPSARRGEDRSKRRRPGAERADALSVPPPAACRGRRAVRPSAP